MKQFIIAALLAALALPCSAQGERSSILAATGASCLEELSESELERYEYLYSHPINLNTAGKSRLLASGLFSPYQIASLLDYQSRLGDILSYSELSRVDGFSEDVVSSLRPFISLESGTPAGRSSRKVSHSTDLLANYKAGGAVGAKLKFAREDRYAVSVSYRDELSANLTFLGKKGRSKVILGNYNARFAQGLMQWSGFRLSSLSSINAFCMKANGISPSWTFNPDNSLWGIGSEFSFGSHSLTALTSTEPGAMTAMVSVSQLSLSGQVGISVLWKEGEGLKIGADFRRNVCGVDIFTEAVYKVNEKRVDALLGAIWNIEYTTKLAGRVMLADDKLQSAAGFGWNNHFISIEDKYDVNEYVHTVKLMEQSLFPLSDRLNLNMRISEKYTSKDTSFKHDLRLDLIWDGGLLYASGRVNGVYCIDPAGLVYAEFGVKPSKFAFYLRGTGFKVDNWADRIYCYERDAPGGFNVPAYYGRGFRVSFNGSVKLKHSRFHLVLSYLDSTRSRKFECKLQYRLTIG